MEHAMYPPELESAALAIMATADPAVATKLARSVEEGSADLDRAVKEQRDRYPLRTPLPAGDLARFVLDVTPRILRRRHYQRLLALSATGPGGWNPGPVASEVAAAVEKWCGHFADAAWGKLRANLRSPLARELQAVEGYLAYHRTGDAQLTRVSGVN